MKIKEAEKILFDIGCTHISLRSETYLEFIQILKDESQFITGSTSRGLCQYLSDRYHYAGIDFYSCVHTIVILFGDTFGPMVKPGVNKDRLYDSHEAEEDPYVRLETRRAWLRHIMPELEELAQSIKEALNK